MLPTEITNGSVVLTAEIFCCAESSNGRFSKAQLELFGINGQPPKGWKKGLLNTLASREVVDEFIALKDKHLTRKRRNAASQRPFFVSVGYSIPWKEQYKHPNWQKMRLHILNRDNFTCQSCGDHHRLLHIHHTKYPQHEFIWNVEPATLETLCDVCHSRKHERDLTET